MRRSLFSLISLLFISNAYALEIKELPVFKSEAMCAQKADWLLQSTTNLAKVYRSSDSKNIVLFNGLVRRQFVISPNVACFDYSNMQNGQQLLRAVKPEAILNIDGQEFAVGGLNGQHEGAYLLPSWLDGFTVGSTDFRFQQFTVDEIKPFLNWKCDTWASNKKQATGKMLTFVFESPLSKFKGLQVQVHYELYDNIPLITKWVSVENKGSNAYKINRVINEVLGMVEEESAVVGSAEQMPKPQGIYFESNYAFNNAMRYSLSDQTTHWKTDSAYTSQVNYNYQTPCVLKIYPENAPGIELQPGEVFQSIRTNELLMDGYDRERRGLAIRKMYRTIAPWTTQNPIFMHLVSRNDGDVKTAVDQCAETGYEALILSFGSHCNMEDTTTLNIQRWKNMADYAHSKGIQIGSYSLFSSRRIDDENDVVSPLTGKVGGAFFGNAPCFGSKWGLEYSRKIKNFYTKTGFNIWENDGPYPGDVCASTTHPGHKGLEDSQWRQMDMQKDLYHWLNERGVYINAPDWYFLDGTHKISIGYREVNFSLSREQQKILNRQNIYDGTWDKTPSMSWGFVPLTRYQGGGPEAVLEPLHEHLKDYEQLMVQYYGAGVQACYRGPRLYDTDETKQLVTNTISWYKKYREILSSDIIHLRRADGRDWDGILHVNPDLKTKGFVMLYNPTDQKIVRTIQLPLYYTGLTTKATIREKEGKTKQYSLNRRYEVELNITIEPEAYTWFVIE